MQDYANWPHTAALGDFWITVISQKNEYLHNWQSTNLEISTGVGEKGLIKAFIDTCLSNEW